MTAKLIGPPPWIKLAARVVQTLPACRYRLMNWLSQRPPPQFWTTLPPALGGFSFACDLRDAIAREVYFTGRYEPQETALLLSLLRPSMTFIDVGANWGYFTLLAAHLVGSTGRVVSFEPDPRLFAMLQTNLARNSLNWVQTTSVAAAASAGSLQLRGFDPAAGNWGVSRLVEDGPTPEQNHRFQVSGESVDQVLDRIGIDTVDVLKMDIEGAEGLALAGMMVGLEKGRYRRILLELHPTLLAAMGYEAQGLLSQLCVLGYTPWHIDHGPAATRRAAYIRVLQPRDFLTRVTDRCELDKWPHFLLLRDSRPPV